MELPGDLARAATPAPTPAARADHAPVLPQLRRATTGPAINGCVATSPNGSTCLATDVPRTATATTCIFGDLGNDWIVGGTGHDTLYGGWGNDLLNADDDLATGCIRDGNGGKCTTDRTRG